MNLQIQKNTPIPIYYQIKEQLLEMISSGMLTEGDMLPSEEVWAKELKISRMTLRNALIQLVNEGFLNRKQGRGTFVAPMKAVVISFEGNLFGFTELVKRAGFFIQTHILDQEIIPASMLIAEKLNLVKGSPVVQIKSLRLLDREPAGVETSYYPALRFGWLAETNLEDRSIYELLQEKGVCPWETEFELESGIMHEREAELLKVSAGMPVMNGTRIAWDKDGDPIEYYKIVLRGDRYKLVARSKKD